MFSQEISEKQELANKFFTKSLEKNQIARAYLFTGKAKKEKLQLIQELNQILNCESNLSFIEFNSPNTANNSLFAAMDDGAMGSADKIQTYHFQIPCGQCQNCQWISENAHPKTPISLESEGHKQNIKVERIREIQSELSQSSDFYRIVIINDASSQVLNRHSATALLKTIEEARANTLFIMMAESRDTVLPTIISRSQVVPFNSSDEVEFSEEAGLLYESYVNWLESGKAYTRLEQLLESESLAAAETPQLIEILQLWQNSIAKNLNDLDQAEKVLKIEQAIKDLRNFIRPKVVFEQLLKA